VFPIRNLRRVGADQEFEMRKLLVIAAIAAFSFGLTACGNGGSAEKAGENVDSAIEEATQGQENLGDGPLEQAGESVDEATGTQDNDDADALNDATDGNSTTNP
jgi:predicted small secreted protein